MRLTDRLLHARRRRDARTEGLEAALGLVEPRLVEPGLAVGGGPGEGTGCPACGGDVHPEVVDLAAERSVLRCPTCQRSWAVPHRHHRVEH